MFEDQYIELQAAVDLITELVRALGHPAPGTYAAYGRLTSIAQEDEIPEAMEMMRRLAAGNETVARIARSVVATAESAGDVATADMATERIEIHEKTAWLLRATAS